MATQTSIEWTDVTWNPVTGCAKVSPGCALCYAEGVADRFWRWQYPIAVTREGLAVDPVRPRQFTDVYCHEDRLDQPLRWRKPRKVFVNSMSDLFHEAVPDAFIDKVFAVMALATQHTFQILTKRAERMRAYVAARSGIQRTNLQDQIQVAMDDAPLGWRLSGSPYAWPLPNVWLGCSVENQHFADERIPLLLQTPAAVRFISAEPLLGPVDLSRWLFMETFLAADGTGRVPTGELDWVIVGGESGPHARPCRVSWLRAIVAQCQGAGVPVFVKQLGANPEGDPRPAERRNPDTGARILTVMEHVEIRNRKGGDPSEWPADLRVRQMPEAR